MRREVCLICPPNGPVECMPLPCASHQRNKYSVVQRCSFLFHVLYCTLNVLTFAEKQKWHQVPSAALHGCARFSAGPSIVGSSLTSIHPIREPQNMDHGGASPFSSPEDCNNHYCPLNPCINRMVHSLHMQMLQGRPDAELQIHRFLLPCCILLDSQNKVKRKKKGAKLVWYCDFCSSDSHNVTMRKIGYRQQYRDWRSPSFLCSQRGRAIRLPIGKCLLTPPECTIQYSLLPDLGVFFRGILQRR